MNGPDRIAFDDLVNRVTDLENTVKELQGNTNENKGGEVITDPNNPNSGKIVGITKKLSKDRKYTFDEVAKILNNKKL